jgi:hypothetical protein
MKKILTEKDLAHIDNIVQSQANIGLLSFAKEFYKDELKLNRTQYIKVNLPYSPEHFLSGNGEGVWACPVTAEDQFIYDHGSKGETFNVYILNDSLFYPFLCASIITVQVTGPDTRPILDKTWLSSIIHLFS